MTGPNVPLAVEKLREAIALHQKHMNGTAPTAGPAGERSQMAMMAMMREALGAIKPNVGGLSSLGMKPPRGME